MPGDCQGCTAGCSGRDHGVRDRAGPARALKPPRHPQWWRTRLEWLGRVPRGRCGWASQQVRSWSGWAFHRLGPASFHAAGLAPRTQQEHCLMLHAYLLRADKGRPENVGFRLRSVATGGRSAPGFEPSLLAAPAGAGPAAQRWEPGNEILWDTRRRVRASKRPYRHLNPAGATRSSVAQNAITVASRRRSQHPRPQT